MWEQMRPCLQSRRQEWVYTRNTGRRDVPDSIQSALGSTEISILSLVVQQISTFPLYNNQVYSTFSPSHPNVLLFPIPERDAHGRRISCRLPGARRGAAPGNPNPSPLTFIRWINPCPRTRNQCRNPESVKQSPYICSHVWAQVNDVGCARWQLHPGGKSVCEWSQVWECVGCSSGYRGGLFHSDASPNGNWNGRSQMTGGDVVHIRDRWSP